VESEGSAYVCEPLTAQGEVIGMLHIQSSTPRTMPEVAGLSGATDLPERLVATLAENLAMALSNLNLREVLRLQSIRDPLTGLFNRRYMEETFERELGRVKRNQAGLTVIMFDVDHFKKYNDSYGHHAGDAVLSHIGSYLKTNVRSEDIPCRYGGEEFLLIMPGLSADGALRRAESIRTGIAHLTVENRGQPLPKVTVSMGVAAFPAHGDSASTIIQAADEALYRAKRNGRNRSFMAGAFQNAKKVVAGTQ
jgi:diguanylate cyclase (GGDEF)-like protein